jgi:signal transduction histidine kinase/sensor domain CHASE-containing protein
MTLRIKSTILIFILITGSLGVLFLVTRAILLGSFHQLELSRANENMNRIVNALQVQVDSLKIFTADWAVWDDSYKFVMDKNQDFVDSNLTESAFSTANINIIAYVTKSGEIVFGKAYDFASKQFVQFPSELKSKLTNPSDSMTTQRDVDNPLAGIVMVGSRPLIVTAMPVVKSNKEGEIHGVVVMGRFFESDLVNSMQKTTRLTFTVDPYMSSKLPGGENVGVASGNPVIAKISGKDSLSGYIIIDDLYNRPAFVLNATFPRDIYTQGQTILQYVAIAMTFIGAVFLLLIVYFWNKAIMMPIHDISGEVQKIAKSTDFSMRLAVRGGKDELTQLARDINGMIEARQKLEAESEKRSEQIANNLHLLEDRNKDLEGAKSAMLNVLEDEKGLQEALQNEKSHIEEVVKERTKELVKAKDKISEGWLLLQQEKARLTASINSLPVGFIMTGADGMVISKNPAAENLLGTKIQDAQRLEDLERHVNGTLTLQDYHNEVSKYKNLLHVKDQMIGTRFIEVFIAPIVLSPDNKDFLGTVILIEDQTEAKILERSKAEFFSIASHELRTPLTAIRGNTSMLLTYYKDKLPDMTMVEMLNDIHASSMRLIDLVNDFLDMSRLEQGRMVFKKQEIDVVPIANEVVKELAPLAEAKKLHLYLADLPNPAIMAYADRDKTKQVLLNLVGNAIKFTDTGEVVVRLSEHEEGGDNKENFVQLSVRDTGRGVGVRNQPLLFRKFVQASDSIFTRDTANGTGLGLYISKLIVEGMGGMIKLARSEINLGSTFMFILPKNNTVAAASIPEQPAVVEQPKA